MQEKLQGCDSRIILSCLHQVQIFSFILLWTSWTAFFPMSEFCSHFLPVCLKYIWSQINTDLLWVFLAQKVQPPLCQLCELSSITIENQNLASCSLKQIEDSLVWAATLLRAHCFNCSHAVSQAACLLTVYLYGKSCWEKLSMPLSISSYWAGWYLWDLPLSCLQFL